MFNSPKRSASVEPQTDIKPTLKELRKTGYLQIAKKIALREINLEKKAQAT